MTKLEHQPCPLCREKALTLTEDLQEIPFFGKVYVFSMSCSRCKFHNADVEADEQKEPCKITFKTQKAADMNVRVVKSSNATVKIPELRMSSTPGPASIGLISNVEGILNKFVEILELQRNDTEDDEDKTKAKKLLKKIWKVKLGEIPITLIIEDPSGNSAIISERAVIEKLKVK